MAKLRTGQKLERVMRFLLGLRNRRVATILAKHGFAQSDLDEGWGLLRALAGEKLDVTDQPTMDPKALTELDEWENTWFPIARASLQHRHPAIEKQVFLNLSQTVGPEVIVSVSTLIQRLKALENGNEEEKTARALLVKRGLSEATVAEAQELLDRLGEVSVWPTVDTVADKEAQLKAEDALWGWYLEWSAIVRAVVKQRKLLRILGFSGGRRSSSGDDPAADRASDPGSDDPVNLVVTPDPGESANDDEDDAQADIAVNG